MADSPGSPLSSLSSDDFAEDVKTEDLDHHSTMPPAKRQRIGRFSHRTTPDSHSYLAIDEHVGIVAAADHEDATDISSDTSGDVPGSPTTSGFALPATDTNANEEALGHEQVTFCKWDGCPAGDLGDMDALVEHIHKDHIGARQKKYSCEWEDCSRKGMPHASGYALRAHMRSHTREKPFYCALPECDRSFTRSDALAKHMRTVHETEALRPSDPVPKHHSASVQKPQRIKLICSTKPPDQQQRQENAARRGDLHDDGEVGIDADTQPLPAFEYPDDVRFTEEELLLRPDELFRLLRRQVHWAEEEGRELKAETEALEAKRKGEWLAKELVLANVMEAELATALDRGAPWEKLLKLDDDLPHPILPMAGATPWYRMVGTDVKDEMLL